ncbi:MAG TPA: carboxylesterase family protein [Xanthomonadales bacterium]|nr:carboxylesterase family protein [Xanthomonadales bacterium]
MKTDRGSPDYAFSLRWVRGAWAAALCLLMACSPSVPPPEVSTNGESLRGEWVDGEDSVAVFRGVPFAAPPTGDMRWRAPREHQARPGLQKATEFAPACMQGQHIVDWYTDVAEAFGHGPEVVGHPSGVSEDCLYLNIWTPELSAEANLPVMVYVHGGSNKGGWSYEPNYLGGRLAGRGAVVVSIAYRLGPLGFFSHPALENNAGEPVANFGLLDIEQAFRWINQNIRNFGGDPNNLTGFGESAGAANLLTLALATDDESGLFRRVIAQSTGGSMSKLQSLAKEQANGQTMLSYFDLGPDVSIEALQSLSAAELLDAAEERLPGHYYAPVIDGDLIQATPLQSLREGSGSKLEVLIGTNADEWLMYLEPDSGTEQLEKWIMETAPEFAGSLLALAAEESSPRKALDKLETASNMLCPSRLIAATVTGQGGQAYLYYFTRQRPGEGGNTLGVYHGAELPYVFDQHDSWFPVDEVDQQVTQTVMDYWLAFARNGSPDSPGHPGWPVYTSSQRFVMELGENSKIFQAGDTALCRYLGPVR